MNRQNKISLITGVVIILITLCNWVYITIRRNYENNVLKNTESTVVTWAIYSAELEGKGITGMRFYYYNQFGEKKFFEKTKYYKVVNVGDTVTIRYSKADNSVVRVIKTSWDIGKILD